MSIDFKANQLRTSQIILSGANGSNADLIIYGKLAATDTSGGYSSFINDGVGTDVFLFVSGSTSKVTLFGGPATTSGSFISKIAAGTTSYTGDRIVTSATTYQLLNTVATTVNIAGAADVNIGGSSKTVTIPGNLTVNGITTTIDSVNLVVKDPLIYIASGSVSSSQNGGIAIASGSSVASEALVIGRVDNDTWGVGRKDVVGGTSTDLTSGVTLVAMRASRFEVADSVTAITNTGGGNLTLSGSNIDLTVGGTNKVVFSSDSVQKLGISSGGSLTTISGSNNQDVKLAAGTGTGNLFLSGTQVVISTTSVHGGADVSFFVSGSKTGKTNGNGVSVFGGDVVISGTIYDGAGALFSGGGSSNWNELSPSPRLNSTASVAIAGAHGSSFAAESAGSDVFFFVSGSSAGTNISLFSGNVISSGSINVKNASGATVFTATNLGAVSGSGNLQTGGTHTVVGDIVSSGSINVKNASGATVFTATNLGAVSGSGNLQVGGTLTVAGSTTLGDASGDAVTINASSVSIPNNLTFGSTLFHLDSSNNRVGVRNNSPEYDFVVDGDTRLGAAGGDNHYMTGTFRQLGDSFLFGTVIIGVDASDQHQVTGTLDLLHDLYVRTGPTVLSGTVIIGNNQVTQHQVTGTLNLRNDLFVSGTMQIGTIPGVNHYITGTLNVKDGVAIGTGEITTTASEFKLANVSTPTVRIGGDADVFIGGSSKTVTIPGNFTVNGTTTTINSVNLVVKDPLIYIASGSVSSNQNGGIAIASGSSVTGEALVIGRMDNDTWGVGRKDVVGGTSTDLTAGVTLVAMRASRFEFNPTVAMINNGTGNLTLSGSNIDLTVGGTNKVVFSSDSV